MKKHPQFLAYFSLFLVQGAFASEADLKAQIEKLNQQITEQHQAEQVQIEDLKKKISAQATPTPASDTTIGGYGELTFNRYSQDPSKSVADLKRFVLFFGHRFDDQWSFNSEVEWEHAVTSSSDQGESEIEQAYLNYRMTTGINLKLGLFLMPFGFLNESHEPPVFYGVERNEVETRIIPSTWREGGLSVSGDNDLGLDWSAGLTTSFDIAKFNDASAPLSSVHQELQFAKAHDPAIYAALNYKNIPGYVLGGALFNGNSAQGNADYNHDQTQPNFAGMSARITLWDLHTRLQKKGWDLEALYARGTIGDAERIDQTIQAYNLTAATPRQYIPSAFNGWLLQAAYTAWRRGDATLTPFVRFEEYNTESQMPSGFVSDSNDADKVATVGVSFKPLMQLVIKVDYQKFMEHSGNDRFNVGIGYLF